MEPAYLTTLAPAAQQPVLQQVPLNTPPPQTGCLKGRCCSKIHPIQGCTLGGVLLDIVLTVGGVVGCILTKDTSTLASVCLGIAGGFGAISSVKDGCATGYLCAWRPQKSLEEAVEATTKATESLKTRIRELTAQTETLSTTKASLERSLLQEQAHANELTLTIQTHDQSMLALHTRLAEIQTALDKTVQLKISWQAIAQSISREVVGFNESVKSFTTHDVEANITHLVGLSQSAETEATEGRELIQRIVQARTGWVQLLQGLYQNFAVLKTDVEEKNRLLHEQALSIDQLRQANTTFESSIVRMQPLLAEFRTLTDKYAKAKSNFDRVDQELQKILSLDPGTTLSTVKEIAQRASVLLRTL
jgi:hypothetical protein